MYNIGIYKVFYCTNNNMSAPIDLYNAGSRRRLIEVLKSKPPTREQGAFKT